MTLSQRAQAAADWLNAGSRWRVTNYLHLLSGPTFAITAHWLRMDAVPQSNDGLRWSSWLTSQEIIETAIAEGWTPQPAPASEGQGTGQNGGER